MDQATLIKNCYNDMSGMTTAYDAFGFMKDLCSRFGFNFFSVISMPVEIDEHLESLVVLTNWPPELLKAYDKHRLLQTSPIISSLRSNSKPLEWELEPINSKRDENERNLTVSLFAEFDMLRGVYFPAFDNKGQLGAVSFSGDRPILCAYDKAILHLLSQHFFNRLSNMLRQEQNAPQLTTKERECLLWASRGKTNGEIASIAGITESAIASRMNTICQKLSATNKTQAVAEAIKQGYLVAM